MTESKPGARSLSSAGANAGHREASRSADYVDPRDVIAEAASTWPPLDVRERVELALQLHIDVDQAITTEAEFIACVDAVMAVFEEVMP